MLDAVQIPILLKAIDFVFDEGRRILEERRERRKAEPDAPKTGEPQAEQTEQEIVPLEPEKAEEIKKDLTSSKIDEILWQSHEMEVKHLVTLLETYSRNYHIALDTLQRREAVLSKVYKKTVIPPNEAESTE